MQSYSDQVLDIIESFSIFDGSVLDCAKGVFRDSNITGIYPSNAALCCINIANYVMHDEPLKENWKKILFTLQNSDLRHSNKPKSGVRLYHNIIAKSNVYIDQIDLDKHKYITEVSFSGSKIGY